MKPGWKTTEFWLACAAMMFCGMFIVSTLGKATSLDRMFAFCAVAAISVGYSAARAIAKR